MNPGQKEKKLPNIWFGFVCLPQHSSPPYIASQPKEKVIAEREGYSRRRRRRLYQANRNQSFNLRTK